MDELTQLIDKNFYVITHLFEYGSLKSEILPNDKTKARVISNRFQSISEIKSYLLGIYVSSEVNRLLYAYFDDRPLYFEENGELMTWVDLIPGAGYFGKTDQYQISMLTKTSDEISCVVSVPIYVDTGEEPEVIDYTVSAQRENGWKLTHLFG